MTTTDTAPSAPGALPLIGHAGRLARDRLGFLEELRALGPVVRIRLGRTPVHVVNAPELVQRMLVAGNGVEFDKGGPFFDQAAQLVGDGLSTSLAGPHRPMRAALRPVFARHRLPHHTERFRDCALDVTSTWRSGQPVEPYTEMKRFAVAVLARTLFLAPEDRQAVEVVQRNVPVMLSALATHMMVPGSNRLPTPENLRNARATRETRAAVAAMVRRRMSDPTDHHDLMSALVPPDRPDAHTEQEVFDQVITFFIGGTETMSSLLSWTLHLLSRHTREYERLEAELDEVLGDRRPLTYQDLSRLTYMRRVINESLRLHPPVWLLSRVALVDTELGGHPLPAGAGLLFSPYALHRDPDVFTEPERFDPDRWSEDRVERRHREAFIPFGAGTRRCIGDTFGLAEAQTALAVILRDWRVRPRSGASPEPLLRMTMRPQGTRLVLDRRTDRALSTGAGVLPGE